MSYAQVLHLLLGESTSVVWGSTSVVSGYSSSRVSVSPASEIFTIEVEFECNTILVQAIPSTQSFATLASLFFPTLSFIGALPFSVLCTSVSLITLVYNAYKPTASKSLFQVSSHLLKQKALEKGEQ